MSGTRMAPESKTQPSLPRLTPSSPHSLSLSALASSPKRSFAHCCQALRVLDLLTSESTPPDSSTPETDPAARAADPGGAAAPSPGPVAPLERLPRRRACRSARQISICALSPKSTARESMRLKSTATVLFVQLSIVANVTSACLRLVTAALVDRIFRSRRRRRSVAGTGPLAAAPSLRTRKIST